MREGFVSGRGRVVRLINPSFVNRNNYFLSGCKGRYFWAKCQGAQGQITLIRSGKTYKFVPT